MSSRRCGSQPIVNLDFEVNDTLTSQQVLRIEDGNPLAFGPSGASPNGEISKTPFLLGWKYHPEKGGFTGVSPPPSPPIILTIPIKPGIMASFPKFCEFAYELQMQIWMAALEQPAVHFFTAVIPEESDTITLKLDRRSAYYHRANVAVVCSTSRQAARNFRRDAGSWTFQVNDQTQIELLIDPRHDIVGICVEPPYRENLLDVSNGYWPNSVMRAVRRLAIEFHDQTNGVPAGCRQRVFANASGANSDDSDDELPPVVGNPLVITKLIGRFPELEEVYLFNQGLPKPQKPVRAQDLIRFRGAGASTDLETAVFASADQDYYEVTTPADEPTDVPSWWKKWKISEYKRIIGAAQRSHNIGMTVLRVLARAANAGALPGHDNYQPGQVQDMVMGDGDEEDLDEETDIEPELKRADEVEFKVLSG